MPYLSWYEAEHIHRFPLEGECVLGRDPVACNASVPQEASVSRQHAMVMEERGQWWIKDLSSHNGTFLNGLAVGPTIGSSLADGDEIQLGNWKLHYTDGFPGLDGENFIERVGDIFTEVRPEPSQALVLIRGLELLHHATEAMLQESNATSLVRSLLSEAIKLLGAKRGFVVQINTQGGWKNVHRIGNVEDQMGLSHSVVSYVVKERTAVLSNAPLMDPRFGGASLVELYRGALMCAPMEFEGTSQGVVYIDRMDEDRPFVRFDLALFQAFVRQGSITLRHMHLAQKAMGQAEMEGTLLRVKSLHDRLIARTGEIFGAMQSVMRWLQSYGEKAQGETAEALRHQVERLLYLAETGIQETLLETPRETSRTAKLEDLQSPLEASWTSLAKIRAAQLTLAPVPPGQLWMAGNLAVQAVMGLVEPVLMRVAEGAKISGSWQEASENWVLRIVFPAGIHGPTPDSWTVRALQESGIEWHWADHALSMHFPKGIESTPSEPIMPLLGLVTVEHELMNLFQSVAEAGNLSIFPLEKDPPTSPMPRFHYLVIDAQGLDDPIACLHAFRRHPSFVTVPILVVRAPEEHFTSLLAAGATDLLPVGFKWEALHHRLQVLKGHDELQRKAMAAERLDSLRQMAGSLKHEINNPLAVISIQVEMLERKYPEETKLAKIGEMVERIRGLMQVLQKMREAPAEDYPGGASIVKLS